MSFFVLPQKWITPAIAAAAVAFGPVPDTVHVQYFRFDDPAAGGAATPPATIWVDKRRTWDKRQAQCLIVHEYGHLAGRRHRKRGIMSNPVPYRTCARWLRQHEVTP